MRPVPFVRVMLHHLLLSMQCEQSVARIGFARPNLLRFWRRVWCGWGVRRPPRLTVDSRNLHPWCAVPRCVSAVRGGHSERDFTAAADPARHHHRLAPRDHEAAEEARAAAQRPG